jgi:hypothetical protein
MALRLTFTRCHGGMPVSVGSNPARSGFRRGMLTPSIFILCWLAVGEETLLCRSRWMESRWRGCTPYGRQFLRILRTTLSPVTRIGLG